MLLSLSCHLLLAVDWAYSSGHRATSSSLWPFPWLLLPCGVGGEKPLRFLHIISLSPCSVPSHHYHIMWLHYLTGEARPHPDGQTYSSSLRFTDVWRSKQGGASISRPDSSPTAPPNIISTSPWVFFISPLFQHLPSEILTLSFISSWFVPLWGWCADQQSEGVAPCQQPERKPLFVKVCGVSVVILLPLFDVYQACGYKYQCVMFDIYDPTSGCIPRSSQWETQLRNTIPGRHLKLLIVLLCFSCSTDVSTATTLPPTGLGGTH